MKNSEEMIASLFERRQHYLEKKKIRRQTIMKMSVSVFSVCLICLLGIVIARSGSPALVSSSPETAVQIPSENSVMSGVESETNTDVLIKPLVAYATRLYESKAGDTNNVLALWEYRSNEDEKRGLASPTATVEFNGKQYSGGYNSSSGEPRSTYIIDRYVGEEAFFDINRETGELCMIMLRNDAAGDKKDTCTEEEARHLAEEIASQYINLNEYHLVTVHPEEEFWGFQYYREIDGILCWDGVGVVIGYGRVVSFEQFMIKEFSEGLQHMSAERVHAFTERISSGEVEQAIEAQLGMNGTRNVEYEICLKQLVMLPDNQLGLYCIADCTVEIPISKSETPLSNSYKGVFLLCEEGAVPVDPESQRMVNTPFEEVIYCAPHTYMYGYSDEIWEITGEDALAIQEILTSLYYENEPDHGYEYVIYVGDTWYGYQPYGGFLCRNAYGCALLSPEMNELLCSMLSIDLSNSDTEPWWKNSTNERGSR